MASETTVDTFADTVEWLLDLYDIDRSARSLRQARRAVITAYRDLPSKAHWSYFKRRVQFQTEASQAVNLAYDHTGGTYERLLTLTTGTWPTNAALGRVLLDSVAYDIEERKSNTEVTLSVASNPGADVAATDATWFRSVYTLPVRFIRSGEFYEIASSRRLTCVTPSEISENSIGDL